MMENFRFGKEGDKPHEASLSTEFQFTPSWYTGTIEYYHLRCENFGTLTSENVTYEANPQRSEPPMSHSRYEIEVPPSGKGCVMRQKYFPLTFVD